MGITGSLAKTSTKEQVAEVLEEEFEVLRNPANWTNEIGLPMTLLRLRPEHEVAVLEMGLYTTGEIALLASLARPSIGVITAYVPVDGKIWMTATRERVRIKAIARDGRSSIVITSKGTSMGGGKTVTYKGHTVIHDDAETKMWFYKLLAAGMAMSQDEGNAFTRNLDPDMFVRFLDTPERVVLEFTPEMSIPFDGDKMAAGTAAAYAQFAAEDAGS